MDSPGLTKQRNTRLHDRRSILRSIVGVLLFILLSILLIPSLIYRKVVQWLQPFLRPDLVGIVPCSSTAFAQGDRGGVAESAIMGFADFKGRLSKQTLTEMVQQLIATKDDKGQPAFQELTLCMTDWMGLKFWTEEEAFSISPHVFEYELDEENESTAVEEEFWNRRFPSNRSPWEVALLHTKHSSKLILRVHHAFADGYALLHLLKDLCQTSGTVDTRLSLPGIKLPSSRRIPKDASKMTVSLIKNSVNFHPVKSKDPPKENRWTLHPSFKIPIASIQGIKRRHGVAFSSVVYAAIFGGIREWSRTKGMSYVELPWAAPVYAPGHPGKLTNHFAFTSSSFWTDVVKASDRLHQIDTELQDIKVSWLPLLGLIGFRIHGAFVNWIGSFIARFRFAPLIISYFPVTLGGNQEWSIGGIPVSDISFCARVQGFAGMVVAVSSFGSDLTIRCVSDTTVLPPEEARILGKLMEEEISKLTIEDVENDY